MTDKSATSVDVPSLSGGQQKSDSNLSESVAPAMASTKSSELTSRIVSGIFLSVITLGLLWVGAWPFAILIAAAAIVMSWEWSRLVRSIDHDGAFIVQGASVAFAALTAAYGMPALGLIGLLIGAGIVFFLTQGDHPLLSVAGVFYIGLPAISMTWLRSDEPLGFLAVLFVYLVVWVSDTSAYIAGRGLGGPKLWPDISPNKTWAGFGGALVGSAIAGALFAIFITKGPPVTLALTAMVLGGVAQAGDLAESALKRHFNVKDVSGLIPGHGGFMDRLDSIVAVSMCAGILALFLDPSAPARALFFGS